MRLIDFIKPVNSKIFFDGPVIVADEIARQIDELEGEDNSYSPPAGAYGVVAPPFPQFFVEARSEAAGHVVERGVLFTDLALKGADLFGDYARQAPPRPPGVQWTLRLDGFMRLDNEQHFYQYNGFLVTHLGRDGRILDNTLEMVILEFPYKAGQYMLHPKHLANFYPFAMKAISAMHLRCEVDEVTPSRQQRRFAQRKHGVQLHSYYVLKVRPGRPANGFAEIGAPAVAPAKRREHVVRGHFRYYHPDRPLFGHTSGMVWIPQHERGAAELGTIDKDYEVGHDQ